MARTSANRDWNHLHMQLLTSKYVKWLAFHTTNLTTEQPPQFKPVKMSSMGLVLESASIGSEVLVLSNYSSVFAVSSAPSDIHEFDTVVYTNSTNLTSLVAGSKPVVLVVPADWVPNHGIEVYNVPIVPVLKPPKLEAKQKASLVLNYQPADTLSYEFTLHGDLPDTVVVGNSRIDSTVFYSMARTFAEMALSEHWKPMRTIRFVSFPSYSAKYWFNLHKSWVKRRVVAYIDTSSPLSVSPLLTDSVQFMADQMVEAGVPFEYRSKLISCYLGANSAPLEFQIPSVSANSPSNSSSTLATTQFLNLMLAHISQEPFLPFKLLDMSGLMENLLFYTHAKRFDKEVEVSKTMFTTEFPWYQWTNKLRALADRKRVNLRLLMFRQCLAGPDNKHLLIASNDSWNSTIKRSISDSDFAQMMGCFNRNVFI